MADCALRLVVLAGIVMPAHLWAGDYELEWHDSAWVERHADFPEREPPDGCRLRIFNGQMIEPLAADSACRRIKKPR